MNVLWHWFFRWFFQAGLVGLALVGLASSSHAGMAQDFERAVRNDDSRTVTTLLLRGANVNQRDAKGQSMLTLAIREKAFKVVQRLLIMNALDVEARNAQDESPLMLAAFMGQASLVQQLIDKGADVNKTGWTPLHYAATKGHVTVMQILLENHAYIDAQSPNNTTPLMMAAMYGTPQAVQCLIDAGADVALRNEQGRSALDFAVEAHRTEAEKILRPLLASPSP